MAKPKPKRKSKRKPAKPAVLKNRDPREIESVLHDQTSGLTDKIVRYLGDFTVALLAISDEPNKQFELAGTGTLVQLDGKHFILTARHVWEAELPSGGKLKDADQMGVTLKPNINHRFPIPTPKVVVLGPPRPEDWEPRPKDWDEWGPDIVLLLIPPEYIGSIGAVKSFWNLSKPDKKPDPPREVLAMDILMGTPAVLGTFIGAHAELQITGIFFSNLEIGSTRGEFDYCDFAIDVSRGVPTTFGGVSGGGLWEVHLYFSSSGKIDWTSVLRGVAFHQSPLAANHRTIRCHGKLALKAVIKAATPSS